MRLPALELGAHKIQDLQLLLKQVGLGLECGSALLHGPSQSHLEMGSLNKITPGQAPLTHFLLECCLTPMSAHVLEIAEIRCSVPSVL